MSYQITLTPEASRDLREIYRYIAVELQAEQTADRLLDRLEGSILKLQELPERFRVYDREPWRSRNLRMMPVDHYLGGKNRHGAPRHIRRPGYGRPASPGLR